MPKWHATWLSGCGVYQNSVIRDVLDAPGAGSQQEHVADARFEDHLFVEFADSAASLARITGKKDTVKSSIRNCSAIYDCYAPRALSCGNKPIRAIPNDSRLEFGKFVRGVAARQ